ncbi:MAG: RluA family pseudouridine synthase [Betaproteobacteria bacterium]
MTHEPTAWTYEPAAGLPTVIHLDEALVVVDKPSGLLSVPGRLPQHHDSALLRLMEPYGPLWVVHRLDMDTSGLIAFARTREAAAHLGWQFERHSIAKRYVALVWGRPPSQQGTIALPLRIDSHQLRVHLSAVGLPIVGDRFYGRPSAEEPGVGRLMLHAQTLELRHPASNQPLRLEAPSAF